MTVVAAGLAVLVLAVSGGGWAVLRHYDGKVDHIELAFSDSANRPSAAGGGTQNILLVGSDTRDGTAGEFGQTDGQRSDTTMLAHLDRDGSTTLVSFPRDLWVEIPAYTDAAGTTHDPQEAKLNAAFAFGGPTLLVRTIESLTGIRVDHYVQVDFVGFQAMTDALGGVTVCVRELPPELKARGFDNLNDSYSGWHGQVGDNTLNGAQALAFVRQRYGLPGSDIDRIRRQQQFLGAIFREVAATSTLLNPNKLLGVVDAATSALTLDVDSSLADLQLLAVRMQGISGGGVTFATVPATAATIAGQSVLVTDPAELAVFLEDLGGEPATAAASAAPVAEPVVRRVSATGTAVGASASPATANPLTASTGPLAQDATEPAGVSCTY